MRSNQGLVPQRSGRDCDSQRLWSGAASLVEVENARVEDAEDMEERKTRSLGFRVSKSFCVTRFDISSVHEELLRHALRHGDRLVPDGRQRSEEE